MTTFLNSQLDFIYFVYGLAFLLLGGVCAGMAGLPHRREAWWLLAGFGFVHGAVEWCDLTALLIGDTPWFAAGRAALTIASFGLLAEFGRREALRFGTRSVAPWLYLPLLGVIGLAGALGGVNAAHALARCTLGLFGALAAAHSFLQRAEQETGRPRLLLRALAVTMALYAVAAGLVVPEAPFWSTGMLTADAFMRAVGVPIQLVRGVLAGLLAFLTWRHLNRMLAVVTRSERYRLYLRRQFVWALVAILLILPVGWLLTESLGNAYRQQVEEEAGGDIDLLTNRLDGETGIADGIVNVLASFPAAATLAERGAAELPSPHDRLDLAQFARAASAQFAFLLDRSGQVSASTETAPGPRSAATLGALADGFGNAITGGSGHRFVVDPVDGGRYYWASRPVRDASGAIVGIAVLKKSLDPFDFDLQRFVRPFFVVDEHGVVMLTNRPALLGRALWPDPARWPAAEGDGPAADGPLLPPLLHSEIADAQWASERAGRHDFYARRYANHGQWSMVVQIPGGGVFAGRFMGLVVTLLLTVMVVIYLSGKEHAVRDNIRLNRQQQLEDTARHLRVQASTDPLTGLANRLGLADALAAELARAARYKTPFSLVLYDVDHFKLVNDRYGHPVGDAVLVQLSLLALANTRATDLLARWGGEEFLVLAPGCDEQMACEAAEKIRQVVAETQFEHAGSVTCSFGVAEWRPGDTAATLTARADAALYCAKLNGRNRVEASAPPPARERETG